KIHPTASLMDSRTNDLDTPRIIAGPTNMSLWPKIELVDPELSSALDDLILGRGVARGRHSMRYQGRIVRKEFEERLAANGFRLLTVREAPIVAGEKIPAFYLHDDILDFGYIRWEIFTPRSRRKLFASEYRRPDNEEWAVQLNLASQKRVWANPALKEKHDVDTVVAVNP